MTQQDTSIVEQHPIPKVAQHVNYYVYCPECAGRIDLDDLDHSGDAVNCEDCELAFLVRGAV